ncbi:hypothetical protein CEUSTIGMA_g14006.t1 [Chlamydomonas eustigma]|uniref:Rhamnogalacturonase A/B/Epimerase-like pectate lyase domain-containing protein n=1 Tax=Chlamydomonas eustigma TaxID=1157962 RepID=A0A250XU75_9CHLO|nr:hypothetical protein CEUSTIGMA_g14006.t1 [Chlamydomonas eustigma]|eukprot:GAX86598.1 hypothetical protein CEUSTIGMA_g14006.t1 [Chlamydomonas eustigma]
MQPPVRHMLRCQMIVVVVVNSVTLLTLAASLTAASAERLGMYSVPPSDDQIILSGANMQSQSKFSADWGHSGRLVNENGQHKAANREMIEAVRSRAVLASGKMKHKKHPHPKAKSTPPKVKPPPPLVTSLPPQPISPPQKSKPPPPKANSPSQHSSQKKSSSPSLMKHPPPAKLMSPSPQIITTPNSQALAPAPAFGSASPPSSVHTSPPLSKLSMYPLPSIPSPPPSITSKSPLPPITVTQPPSVSSSSLVQPYYSSLYSSTGESQTGLNSRLMDWSYAGYQAGELPLPEHPVSCSVSDFGAQGNNISDDTFAFINAIASLSGSGGVVYIPPGTYQLSQQLYVKQSNTVLRGAGQGITILYFTKSMTDLFGQNWTGGMNWGAPGEVQSNWKNAPGLIRFLGPNGPDAWIPVANITANATRGSNVLQLSNTSQIQAGQWMSFSQEYTGISLPNDMNMRKYSYSCPKCESPGEGGVLRWHSRVTAVNNDNTIVLERNLPFNVSNDWNPVAYQFMEGISNIGIEYLTIHMKWQGYAGHFKEAGWNGVEFTDTSHCWARNITILNGDTLLSVDRSSFCTITNITTGVTAKRNNFDRECHHGMNTSNSQDILFSNITHTISCYHDITVFNLTVGVVFANVSGVDVAMDGHRFYTYGTLYSNVSLGAGTHPFLSGGLSVWGCRAASFTTYWNVTPTTAGQQTTIAPPGYDMGPNVNFVGMNFAPTVIGVLLNESFSILLCRINIFNIPVDGEQT